MANGVAYSLATEGLKKGEQLYLQNEVPEYVVLVLEVEGGVGEGNEIEEGRKFKSFSRTI
ncbi:hypothetical protein Godav_018218, partial [Gossypium davidsonii]|nr:hypothetical protein [Gossypium davidsonii]